ncbi:unnamed protein product [Closterium sp. Yama58-4]|nr:unnamed protein product [Closterium sp. Yama58-4]
MTKLSSHAFASSLARQVARFFAASSHSAEAATAGAAAAASPVPKQQALRATAATSHWNDLGESSSARSSGSARSLHGQFLTFLLCSRPLSPPLQCSKSPSNAHLSDALRMLQHAGSSQQRQSGTQRLGSSRFTYTAPPLSLSSCPFPSFLPFLRLLFFPSLPAPVLEIPSNAHLPDALRMLQHAGLTAAPVRDVVLEVPSNAKLSDALRMLQHAGLTAAPVRDVAVGDDAPLQQRYLGMVDGAGIVYPALTAAPVRDVGVGDDAPLQQRYLGMVDGAGIVLWVMGQQRYLGMVDGAGIVLWVMGQLNRSSIEVRMEAAAGGGLAGLAVAGLGAASVEQMSEILPHAHSPLPQLNQSSIEVRMAAAAGGGLAGMAFGGLGAAVLGAPDVATLAAMWAGSMAGGLLGATSAEAPGEGEAGGGVERLRVSAGGLDRLLQGSLFQTAKVSDLVGSFRWRSFLPLASSDSVLSLMLLLAMPHRPQVLPIVTYPPTSSAPFSSSPSSASPTSSPGPAAATSSAGSGPAAVPSLSALVSQADVVNFLAECDGQPWFEWVAGRSLQDMGLPRMGAEATVKVS